MNGAGTWEDDLIEILVPLSNKAVRMVCDYYKKEYGQSLATDIEGDTSGYFRSLLVLLTASNRKESNFNQDNKAAVEIAQILYKHQDEMTFNAVLATVSLSDLRKSFVEYKKISGKDIEDVIINENLGDSYLKEAYLQIGK
ncbi:annexin B9-like [Cotesia typhae]